MGQTIRYRRNILKNKMPFLYMAPTILWILFFMIYPLIFSIVMSLKRFKLERGVSFWGMKWVGLDNFKRAFADKFFLQSLEKTFIILVVAVTIEFFLGMCIALLLNKKGVRFDFLWIALILSPMMLPLIASGNLWRMLFDTRWGVINAAIMSIGLNPIDFLGNPKWSLIAVIIVEIWQWTPFVVIILLAGLRSIPDEPKEAALVDGATNFQTFRYVMLPLMAHQILIVLLIRSMDVFKTFDIVYALTFGGPGQSTTVVSFYIYRQAFTQFKLGYAATLSWIVFIIIYLMSFTILKFVKLKDVT